jgi:hypothetical protein
MAKILISFKFFESQASAVVQEGMSAASLGIGSNPMGNLATTRLLFPKVSFPNYFIRLKIVSSSWDFSLKKC